MRKWTSASIILLGALAGKSALAQNSDLGLLLGVSGVRVSSFANRTSVSVGASGQVNYAYQVHGTEVGDLYLEFPVVLAASSNVGVSRYFVSRAAGATILFTPGLRFKLRTHSRITLYGAIGAGVGSFAGVQNLVVWNGFAEQGRIASPAFGFGGGADIRLTRLLSLRGEVRDFVTRSLLGGTLGRQHVFGAAGIGFHF